MIGVSSFFDHLRVEKTIAGYSVVCFVGKEYPLLFFSHIFSFLSQHNAVVKTLDAVLLDASLIKAELSTISFSGHTIYWLYGMHELSSKKQQEWSDMLSMYQGPHTVVVFFTDETFMQRVKKNDAAQCVLLGEHIPAHELSNFRFLIDGDTQASTKNAFTTRVAARVPQLSLDGACLLSHYEVVVGTQTEVFCKEWLGNIVEPTHSLFLLSQYFFAKKPKLFFEQWALCVDMYMPPFWITFWADQVWRAYMYCDLMQQKKYAEAKKVQYKLPFSLINRDWSSLKLDELRNAHQFLAIADYKVKNGCSDTVLELFFSTFFEHKF